MSRKPIVVGVINTSPDTVEMLRIVLENAGFVVISAYTHELRSAHVDIEAIVRQYQPRLFIYDIAPPYEKNWREFLAISSMPALRGIDFVVTTTNVRHVKEVAGQDQQVFEIVGKPYDLDILVQAVKDAIARPGAISSRPSTPASASSGPAGKKSSHP